MEFINFLPLIIIEIGIFYFTYGYPLLFQLSVYPMRIVNAVLHQWIGFSQGPSTIIC